MKVPEEDLHEQGYRCIAGIDEVGRGPLAGPVVAAAVVLPEEFSVLGIDDSKKLSEKRREELFVEIKKHAVAWGIGMADHQVIDEINILQATKLAMRRAVQMCIRDRGSWMRVLPCEGQPAGMGRLPQPGGLRPPYQIWRRQTGRMRRRRR